MGGLSGFQGIKACFPGTRLIELMVAEGGQSEEVASRPPTYRLFLNHPVLSSKESRLLMPQRATQKDMRDTDSDFRSSSKSKIRKAPSAIDFLSKDSDVLHSI